MKYKSLFYAVSKRGQGTIFSEKPERDEHFGCWRGRIEGCYNSLICDMVADEYLELPVIGFSDDPVELRLNISYG